MRKTSKETAIESLRQFVQEAGEDLSKRHYQRLGYKPSYPTILALFGSWQEALQEVGKSPVSLRTYTDEQMLEVVRESIKENRGFPSRSAYIRSKRKPSITTIEERFDGWSNAVKEAGYTPNDYVQSQWSEEEMIEALRTFYIHNGYSIRHEEYEKAGIKPSASIIRKKFRTWNLALQEAGIPLNQSKQPKYTDSHLLASMRRIAGIIPCPLSKELYKLHAEEKDPSVMSIIRRFKTWSKALETAGLPLVKKVYSREEMLSLIQSFIDHVGEDEASFDLYVKSGWLPGGTTILRHFGSWEHAIGELGYRLKFAHYTKEWAIEQVKQAVREHGGDITPTQYLHGGYKPSMTWLKSHFGSWRNVKKNVGLN